MRMGELSRTTGIPVPTIKFYLREGLLPAGELTSPNQAHYEDRHVRRLHLIRALTEVGGLPLAAVGKVVEAVEDHEGPVHELLGAAARTIDLDYPQEADAVHREHARSLVEELIDRRGWQIRPDHPAAAALTSAAASFLAVGHGDYLDFLDEFAGASERIAAADLDYVALREQREDLVERVVVGTVLGDAMLAALRRLAQVDASARLFAEAPRHPAPHPSDGRPPQAGKSTSG